MGKRQLFSALALVLVCATINVRGIPFSCSAADTEAHCNRAAHYGCHWTALTETCSLQACNVRHNLADCVKSRGCRWLTSDDACHNVISFPITQASVCDQLNSDTESWFSRMSSCIQFSDECEWSRDTYTCIPNRNLYCRHSGHEEDSCIQNRNCAWETGNCYPLGRHDTSEVCKVGNCPAGDCQTVGSSCLSADSLDDTGDLVPWCANRKAYNDELFDVSIADIGSASCSGDDCDPETDCEPAKKWCHWAPDVEQCIPDQSFACSRQITEAECNHYASACQWSADDGVCVTLRVIVPCSNDDSGSSTGAPGEDIVRDFDVNAHSFNVDPVTHIVRGIIDTGIPFDVSDPLTPILVAGTQGYPIEGTPLQCSTLSSLTDPPSSMPPSLANFKAIVGVDHDFNFPDQDTFLPLKQGGLVKSVDVVRIDGVDKLRWRVEFNLENYTRDCATLGEFSTIETGAGSTYAIKYNSAISYVVRNHDGLATVASTIKLNITMTDAFQRFTITASVGTGYNLDAKLATFRTEQDGCGTNQQYMELTYRLTYTTPNTILRVKGPREDEDIVFAANCYNLEVAEISDTVCDSVNPTCVSTFKIRTECRTITASGNAFKSCSNPDLAGLFSFAVYGYTCNAHNNCTRRTTADNVNVRLLQSVHPGVEVNGRFDLTLGVFKSVTSSFDDLEDSGDSKVSTASQIIPLVVFLDTADGRAGNQVLLDLANISVQALDVNEIPISDIVLWDVLRHDTVHQPKAVTDGTLLPAIVGVPGADGFSVDMLLVAHDTATEGRHFRFTLGATITPLTSSESIGNSQLSSVRPRRVLFTAMAAPGKGVTHVAVQDDTITDSSEKVQTVVVIDYSGPTKESTGSLLWLLWIFLAVIGALILGCVFQPMFSRSSSGTFGRLRTSM